MVRCSIAVMVFVAVIASPALAQPVTPQARLDLGLRAYRAGDFASAVVDLDAASRAPLKVGDATLPGTIETSLVYLTLAQFRLANEDAARDAILRLAEVERFAPTFGTLALDADAADFAALVQALAPSVDLPRNPLFASENPTVPLPRVVAAPDVTPAASPSPAEVDEQLRAQREQLEREFAARLEAERAEAKREADRRVAAAQAEAAQSAAAAQPAAPVRVDAETYRAWLTSLRQADALAMNGMTSEAERIYLRLADPASVPREIAIEAAIGLYRTGSYRSAVEAFHKLGAFARGEEDLRYYYAIALYESGDYQSARTELSCALPFIEVTDEVARYQLRIDQSIATR